MQPKTIPITTPILELIEEMFHTSALLSSYPFLTEQHAQLEAIYPNWNTLFEQELALIRALRVAEAKVIAADDALDFLCTAISATVLAENGGDRKSVAYQRYFGANRPSKLKRPVLGRQLEVMRSWIPSLTGPESSPALQEYGRQLEARVAEADQAMTALAAAEQQKADFEVGARKHFIDELNATRMSLHGQLAELSHRSSDKAVSRDFAKHFFLRGRSAERVTVPDLERRVLRTRERLRRYEQQLELLLEQQERVDSRRQDAEVQAAEAALLELEQQQAAIAAQHAALAERIDELRGDESDLPSA